MRRTQWLKLVHDVDEYYLVDCKKASSSPTRRGGSGKSYKKCVKKTMMKTINKLRKVFSFVSEKGTTTKSMTLVPVEHQTPVFDLPEALWTNVISNIPATKDNMETLKTLAGTCSFFHTLASSSIEKYNKEIFMVHLRDLFEFVGRDATFSIRFIGSDHKEHTIYINKESKLNDEELDRLIRERSGSNGSYSADTEDDASESFIEIGYNGETALFHGLIFGDFDFQNQAVEHVASIIGTPQKVMISSMHNNNLHPLSSIPKGELKMTKKQGKQYDDYVHDYAQYQRSSAKLKTLNWNSPLYEATQNNVRFHSQKMNKNPIVKQLPTLREEAWAARVAKK